MSKVIAKSRINDANYFYCAIFTSADEDKKKRLNAATNAFFRLKLIPSSGAGSRATFGVVCLENYQIVDI